MTTVPHAEFDVEDLDWSSSDSDSAPSSTSRSPTSSPTQALRSLSLASPPSTPPLDRSGRGTGHRRESHSTAATTVTGSGSTSDLSQWTADDSDEDDDEDAAPSHSRERSLAASAPATPISLLQAPGTGGRKRSLTDVLQLDPEQDAGKVAMELASWINASPSPFETDSPCNSPFPRPFPLFRPYTSNSTTTTALLDSRGLPQRAPGTTPSTPAKKSYGFIPAFPGPVGKVAEISSTVGQDEEKQEPEGKESDRGAPPQPQTEPPTA
ncbi:hypothetical protein RQP46_000682 [Phenoliferia psychrophenolica]